MRTPTRALTLTLALTLWAAARGQDDDAPAPPADPEVAAEQGFPWACFAMSVAALGGLYVLVRRREQAAEAEQRLGGPPPPPWYCRACDRDVSGPECPRCGAPNPFLDAVPVADPDSRRRRHRAD